MPILNKNSRVANIKVQCRDGKVRSLIDVVRWFGDAHLRIHTDITAMEAGIRASRVVRAVRAKLVA
jgi:hypothetical protein